MKHALSFLLFVAVGIAGMYLYLLWQKQTVLTRIISPTTTSGNAYSFSLDEAPKDTLRATVSTLSGQVEWTSRTATQPAVLRKGTPLQQGEDIETGSNGKASFDFGSAGGVSLQPDSRVEITQTLPDNMVFRQTAGEATYTAVSAPVSVRILHLILLTKNGTVRVTEDSDTGEITVRAMKGMVDLGYNDLDYVSITEKLQEGDAYIFDDTSRTGQIK